MKKNYSIYGAMLLLFGALIYGALYLGEHLFHSPHAPHTPPAESAFGLFQEIIWQNLQGSLTILLFQIIVILLAVKLFSFLFKYIGQPGVIGEIVAGIVLGPSILGLVFPDFFQTLFPAHSLTNLELLSQIGLILFMFVIGMEVDFGLLKNKMNETLVISHAGIIVPFFLGILASFWIHEAYAARQTDFLPFALFIGISMSITAFPVLARIIQERNMSKTPIGVLAIASAANDDVTAWCLLAIVIAVAKAGSFLSAIYTVGLTLLFIALMFGMIRPFLRKIGERYANEEVINKTFVGSIFLVLILSSVTTEIIGIHALFGAFMAGVVMPTNTGFREVMMEKVEDIALVFFLPLFFAFTGLRTEIGLINTPELWGVCIFLIFIAILGKLGGCTIAARLVGESWKDSLTVGTLMNTRGLMELVALNIGYEMGVLPPEIFVILILMALVTTFMTTPLLKAVERLFQTSESRPSNKFKLLFIFGRPESGKELLAFIAHLFGQRVEEMELIAAHCTIGSDVNPQKAKEYAQTSFTPLEQEAARLKLHVEQRYKVTDHLSREIHQLANKEKINLLFIGSGNRSAQLVQKPFHCPVAIFVNRGIHYIRHPFLLLFDENDLSLLPLVQTLFATHETPVHLCFLTTTGLSPRLESTVKNCIENTPFLSLGQPLTQNRQICQPTSLLLLSRTAYVTLTQTPTLFNSLPSLLVFHLPK